MIGKINRALRWIAKLLLSIIHCGLILDMAVMFVLMIAQIILRSFVGSSIKWADELLRYLFIWLVFLGLPSAVYYEELTRFDMLEEKLGTIARTVLSTLIDSASIVVLYLMTDGAIARVAKQMSHMATTLKLSMGVVYMVLPISAIVSIVFLILNIYLRLAKQPSLKSGEDAK